MVIFLFSDKLFEKQSIMCIKSFSNRVPSNVKIVYFTIGFNSEFELKNLYKFYIEPNPNFVNFLYYKPELSLKVMDLFPNDYYIYTDSDVLFSHRFLIDEMVNTSLEYPLACFGPHEYPFTYKEVDGNRVIYNETKLMNYFNVSNRTMRYVWACFFSFNTQCKDFIEEWASMCNNKYLNNERDEYFPFHDETPFNICLWKRKSTKSFGYSFVNTHHIDMVIKCENSDNIKDEYGSNYDKLGVNWEYVKDTKNILFYHGFKDTEETSKVLDFLLIK